MFEPIENLTVIRKLVPKVIDYFEPTRQTDLILNSWSFDSWLDFQSVRTKINQFNNPNKFKPVYKTYIFNLDFNLFFTAMSQFQRLKKKTFLFSI